MDSLHAIGFYVSSGISLAGGLGIALAGIYLSLSAGFAAVVALVCYLGCAALLAGRQYRSLEGVVGPMWRQLGAVGAAALLALLAYAAFRGDFVNATFYGGSFDVAAIGRLLFERDALATEAAAALVLVALAGATVLWRA